MSTAMYFWYLFLIAGSTYLIRALPFVLVKRKLTNRFIRSFLHYIPYAVLTAMTIPAAFYATEHIASAAIGIAVAILLALKRRSLTTVAVFACAAVFIRNCYFLYVVASSVRPIR